MVQHRSDNPGMYWKENAEELLSDLIDGKKIKIKVWLGIVKDLDLNCPGLFFDPPLQIEGIDGEFNNVIDNVTEAVEAHFSGMAKAIGKSVDTKNIILTFNTTRKEFDRERAAIEVDDVN